MDSGSRAGMTRATLCHLREGGFQKPRDIGFGSKPAPYPDTGAGITGDPTSSFPRKRESTAYRLHRLPLSQGSDGEDAG